MPRTLPVLIALLAFVGVTLHPPNNLDVTWYLVAVRSWAAGGELYVTIRDPNTPAVWYLFRGVHELAVALELPAHRVFYGLAALASLVLLWLTRRILPGTRRERDGVLLAGALLFGFCGLTVAGQRDPLVVLLLLPYLAWTQRLADGQGAGYRAFGVLACLLMGVGLLIKPHFLLCPLLAEALLAWRLRRWTAWLRRDLLLAALVTSAALVLLLLAHPAYLDYLSRYAAYYAAFPAASLSSRAIFGLVLLGLLLLYRLLLKPGDRGWADTLLVAAFSACLIALLQDKWWDYQAVTIEYLAALAWTALLLREPLPVTAGWRRLAIMGLMLGALAWALGAAVSAAKQQLRFVINDYHQLEVEPLAAAFDRLAPGQPVAVLGGWPGPIAGYRSQALWALPDPSYWIVDVLLRMEREGQAIDPVFAQAAERHRDDVIAALVARPPAVLATNRSLKTGDDALGWYLRDPRFQTFWLENYRAAGEARSYLLFLRNDLPLP